MSMQDVESRITLPVTRRAAVLFGGAFAGLSGIIAGLGLDDAAARNKKRKRRRRKNKKRKKKPDQGSFVVVAPEMTGAKEVPEGSGDPEGEGSAECTIKGDEICCDFTFSTTTPNSAISGIHIHEGGPDVDGDIVVPFSTALQDNCVNPDNPSVLAQIKTNPEDFYMNIHTDAFPDGAVRDQLAVKA